MATDKKELSRHRRNAAKARTTKERREDLINHCLKMETWGSHPGQATMRLQTLAYDPQTRQYHKLPGKSLAVLINSPEMVEELWTVFDSAVDAWIAGRWQPKTACFQCECGKLIK